MNKIIRAYRDGIIHRGEAQYLARGLLSDLIAAWCRSRAIGLACTVVESPWMVGRNGRPEFLPAIIGFKSKDYMLNASSSGYYPNQILLNGLNLWLVKGETDDKFTLQLADEFAEWLTKVLEVMNE